MAKRFGKRDAVFFGILLAVLGVLIVGFQVFPKERGGVVVVTVDGVERGRFSLGENRMVEISSPVNQTWELRDDVGNILPKREDGTVTNRMRIEDGKVQMAEADCPDKLCVRHKEISYGGETIVCLPNRVVLTIEAVEKSTQDAIAE